MSRTSEATVGIARKVTVISTVDPIGSPPSAATPK